METVRKFVQLDVENVLQIALAFAGVGYIVLKCPASRVSIIVIVNVVNGHDRQHLASYIHLP